VSDLRGAAPVTHTPTQPLRVAVFASHLHGAAALVAVLANPALRVVLVATDDPSNPICNPTRRVWQHGASDELRDAVPAVARAAGLSAWTGGINGDDFMAQVRVASPDVLLATVFGQRILAPLEYVAGRAYNLHPTVPGLALAATRGASPFERAAAVGASRVRFTIHRMTPQFDAGEELAHSPEVAPPKPGAVLAFLAATSPMIGTFVADLFPVILRRDGLLV